jgi:hypothetical protein
MIGRIAVGGLMALGAIYCAVALIRLYMDMVSLGVLPW